MKRLLIYTILLFSFLSCQEKAKEQKPQQFETIEFTLDAFDWDPNPYKFTSYITDSMLPQKGAQLAAWDYSYIGDIERMHQTWDSYQNSKRKPLSQELKDSFALFKRQSAIPFILEQTKDQQVVIINEAHHMPQHRVFTTQLLEGLKQQGFTHLGLETYMFNSKNDSALQANKYPTLKSGYYTREPQFGNLVRVAAQKGFKVFGYESEGHSNGKEREINQGKNIQEYIAKHPNDKFLIHCGFDHGYEGELSSSWEKAMAGRLTEYTKIDPLTINQAVFSERSKKEYEDPFYQELNINEPSVFAKDKVSFSKKKNGGYFDIFVFHPRSNKFNRPKWMVYGDRKEVKFSFEEADINCPCLVFAYKKGEKIGQAVPYDIIETATKEAILVLDESDFELVIWNAEGKALKTSWTGKN